jgi:formyl-CoA transferase
MRVDLPHPSGGTVKLVRNPINMTGTPPEALAHPPMLGEHTDSILRDVLGYDEAQIARLRDRSVI